MNGVMLNNQSAAQGNKGREVTVAQITMKGQPLERGWLETMESNGTKEEVQVKRYRESS